jgi:hypothetical protein
MKHSMRILFAIVALACAIIPALAQAGFTVRPVVWLLIVDDSASVPADQARRYPEMLRRAAFELMRPNDVVILMRLDSPAVDSTTLDAHYPRLRQQVEDLHARVVAMPRRKRGGHTDFHRVLAHARERMQIERQTGRQDARYVLVFATDGKPDPDRSRKVRSAGDASYLSDWRMLVLGLHPENDAALRAVCREAGFTDESRMLFVSYEQWGSVDGAVARFVERQPDTALQRRLSKIAPAQTR